MTDSPHVIIAGAGFAGLSAVGQLRKAGFMVTVIDKNLYSTFQPLLYQVATGGLNPGDVSYAVGGFTSRRRTRYVRGELAGIDEAARRVRLSDGRELGYDYLMLATGVSANYFGVTGAAENTFGLYTRADAIVLRDHVMNGFERLSEGADPDREFVITVVGGGATGVELAGTAAELRREVIQATFPDVDPARVHVRLIEMAPALVMPFHPEAAGVHQAAAGRPGGGHQAEHGDPRGAARLRGTRRRAGAADRPDRVGGGRRRAAFHDRLGRAARQGRPGPGRLRSAGRGQRPDLRDRRHRAQPAGPGPAARAARDPAWQARGRAGGAPDPR